MKRVKAVSSKILLVFLLTLGMTISTQARMSYFSIVTSSINRNDYVQRFGNLCQRIRGRYYHDDSGISQRNIKLDDRPNMVTYIYPRDGNENADTKLFLTQNRYILSSLCYGNSQKL